MLLHMRVHPWQVIQLCEKKRSPQPRFIVVDTPGQIEIFTWSASVRSPSWTCAHFLHWEWTVDG